jgi:thiol-disulfide isomerase/thioredoxin
MADQMVADETGDTGRPDDEGDTTDGLEENLTLTTDIDLDFAPLPIEGVVLKGIEDETVLFHPGEEIVTVLDQVGGMLWGWFDGEVPLRDIAADIIDVLQVPSEQVEEDLLNLVRSLGALGFLQGVITPARQAEEEATFQVGDELQSFTLPDMDGNDVDLASLRGRQVLLINWSPTCGFCMRIASELAELHPKLADAGVELVLLTSGSIEENQEVFDTNDLHTLTLIRPEIEELGHDHDHDHDEDGEHDHDEDGEHDHGLEAEADAEDQPETQSAAAAALDDDDDDDDLEAYALDMDVFPEDPFPVQGTPVAYLLDAEGKVAAPLATGSTDVPNLARGILGLDQPEPEPEDVEPEFIQDIPGEAKYLNLSSGGTCGPGGGSGGPPRVWAATSAYRVGKYRVGIRADSNAADDVLGRFLSAERMPEGTRVPEDYSLILGDGGTTKRALNLVLQGGSTVIRTRSPRRALMGLAGYLSSHLDETGQAPLRTNAMAIILNGEAVILPADINNWLDELQPRLAVMGGAPVDRSYVSIDPERLEVIIEDPHNGLSLDESVLDELTEPPARRSEQPMVKPGRYPLKRWLIWQSDEDPALTRGQLVARALASCVGFVERFDETVDELDSLRDRGILYPFDFMTIDEMLKRLPLAVQGEPHDHIVVEVAEDTEFYKP